MARQRSKARLPARVVRQAAAPFMGVVYRDGPGMIGERAATRPLKFGSYGATMSNACPNGIGRQ